MFLIGSRFTNQTMTDAYDATNQTGPWQSGSGTAEDPIVNYTAYILGMTINEPAMQTQIENAVAGGIEDLTIMVLAAANIVSYHEVLSYNPSTHRLDFATTNTGPYYPNYMSVAFTGNPDWITQEGHFCMTRSDEFVHYKPLPGSSGDSAILGMLPVMFSNRYPSTNTMNFINSNFFANGPLGAYVCEGSTNNNPTFTNCLIQTGQNGVNAVNTKMTAIGTTFDNMRARGVSSGEGTRLEKCRFTRDEKSSGALIQSFDSNAVPDPSTPVAESVIKDCYFNINEANHGQGFSLYQGAWMNATIEHNIFICQRAHSFQSFGSHGAAARNAGGVYTFNNNLIIHNANADPNGIGGQPTYSFNSIPYPDGETDTDWDMKVYIRNNVVLSNMDDVNLISQFKDYTLDISGMHYTERYVTNNIIGRLLVAAEDLVTYPSSLPTYSGYNVSTVGGWQMALNTEPGSTDVLVNTSAGWDGSQSDYYDWDLLQPIGAAATHASDGGAVGIRWNNNITLATALDPPADWYNTYSAQALPADPTTVPFYFTP